MTSDIPEDESLGADDQSVPGDEVAGGSEAGGTSTSEASRGPEGSAEPTLEQQLAERTADLQRLQAEYVNYKRRVDRDRELVRAQGEAAVLLSLLTVLDDIGRADEHGELEGGFKAVADALQQVVGKHKLEAYGAKGEAFDPSLHEAVFHAGESADVDTTTIDNVLRIGYKHGDRVLRAATVGVVDPASAVPEAAVSEDASAPLTDEAPDE